MPDLYITSQDPSSIAYRLPQIEYLGLVQAICDYTHDKYREFCGAVHLPSDACLMVVGSDGKMERHEQSLTELRIVALQSPLNAVALTDAILEAIYPLHVQLGPDHCIETTVLHESDAISYAFGDPTRVYPDRAINSLYIMGNENVYWHARMQALAEMTADGPISTHIRHGMRDQLKIYRNAAASGVYRGLTIFSADENQKICLQFYDEHAENPKLMRAGFKSGFLRAVQRKLDLLTVFGVRECKWNIEELAHSMPTQTVERIEFMANRGIIPHQLAVSVSDAYAWFLQQYHQAQHKYKEKRQCVGVPHDPTLFNRHRQAVLAFAYMDAHASQKV